MVQDIKSNSLARRSDRRALSNFSDDRDGERIKNLTFDRFAYPSRIYAFSHAPGFSMICEFQPITNYQLSDLHFPIDLCHN